MTQRLAAASIALAAALTLPAPTVGAPSAKAPPKVIRVISITTSSRVEDKAPKGSSVGDRQRTTSRLLNARKQFGRKIGAYVGTDTGWYTQTTAGGVTADGVTRLPGGTLHFKGEMTAGDGVTTIPVVGGTGVFAGAVGTLTIGESPDGIRAVNVYRLVYALVA